MKNKLTLFMVIALASALLLSACSSTNPQIQQAGQGMVTNGQKMQTDGQTMMDAGQAMQTNGQTMMDSANMLQTHKPCWTMAIR